MLDTGKSVNILDTLTYQEREELKISGSLHIDVDKKPKEKDSDALK